MGGPVVFELSAGPIAAKGDNGVGSFHRPEHGGLFEAAAAVIKRGVAAHQGHHPADAGRTPGQRAFPILTCRYVRICVTKKEAGPSPPFTSRIRWRGDPGGRSEEHTS